MEMENKSYYDFEVLKELNHVYVVRYHNYNDGLPTLVRFVSKSVIGSIKGMEKCVRVFNTSVERTTDRAILVKVEDPTSNTLAVEVWLPKSTVSMVAGNTVTVKAWMWAQKEEDIVSCFINLARTSAFLCWF